MVYYFISTRDDFEEKELQDIAAQVSKEGGELFMTLAERLMEKGMEKGIEKGKNEERQELAKNLLIDGMGVELVAKYTKLSKDEVEKIKYGM